mgnify:CR=1 FL=1
MDSIHHYTVISITFITTVSDGGGGGGVRLGRRRPVDVVGVQLQVDVGVKALQQRLQRLQASGIARPAEDALSGEAVIGEDGEE